MIVPGHKGLSRRRQCVLLGISRSSTYYRPKGVSDGDLQLMRAIDEQYTKTPFYGRRRMCVALRGKGFKVSEKRVRWLMRKMGLHAVAPRPNTVDDFGLAVDPGDLAHVIVGSSFFNLFMDVSHALTISVGSYIYKQKNVIPVEVGKKSLCGMAVFGGSYGMAPLSC